MNATSVALLAGAAYLLTKRSAPAPGAGAGLTYGTMGSPAAGSGAAPSGLDGIVGQLGSLVNNLTRPTTTAASTGATLTTGGLNATGVRPDYSTPQPAPVYGTSHTAAVTGSTSTFEDLYRNVLHREADAGGLSYWIQQAGGDVVTQDMRAAWMAAAIPELSAGA